MEEIKTALLQLSSNGNQMTGEIERQRLQSVKSEQLQLFSTLVIFRFVRLNSCTPRQLRLPVRKTESSGLAVFTSGHFEWLQCNVKSQTVCCIGLAVDLTVGRWDDEFKISSFLNHFYNLEKSPWSTTDVLL